MYALITSGLLRDGERSDEPEDSFTAECVTSNYPSFSLGLMYLDAVFYRERREYWVFRSLLSMVPGLEQRLVTTSSDQEIQMIADLVSIFPKLLDGLLSNT